LVRKDAQWVVRKGVRYKTWSLHVLQGDGSIRGFVAPRCSDGANDCKTLARSGLRGNHGEWSGRFGEEQRSVVQHQAEVVLFSRHALYFALFRVSLGAEPCCLADEKLTCHAPCWTIKVDIVCPLHQRSFFLHVPRRSWTSSSSHSSCVMYFLRSGLWPIHRAM
jgi:hypothetical protein